jgi:DNA-directed RNA polymerase subunit RPC12/RpoP
MPVAETMPFTCSACGNQFRIPAHLAGRTMSCPGCNTAQVVPQVALPPAPAAPPAAIPVAPPVDDGKKLFVCSACGYRARIPGHFMGKAVRCPRCDGAQIATSEGTPSPRTGRTVSITKIATAAATARTTVRPGNILFSCATCGFEAQLARHYLGKAIKCPGCHEPQVVAVDHAASEGSGISAAPTPTPAPGPSPDADPATAGKELFVCTACSYRARIPAQYIGLAVTCPACDHVGIALRQEPQASTGDTVAISRMRTSEPVDVPPAPADEGPQVEFACTSCGFRTKLGASLAGKPIRCPGCQATQVVSSARLDGSVAAASEAPAEPGTGSASATAMVASAGAGEKLRFTCTACGFKARIPSLYAGQTIHCPGCNVVQMVLRSGQGGRPTGNTRVLNVVQPAAPAPADSGPIDITGGMPDAPRNPASETVEIHAVSVAAAPASSATAPSPASPALTGRTAARTTTPAPAPVPEPAPAAEAPPAPAVAAVEEGGFHLGDDTPAEPLKVGKVVRRGSDRMPAIKVGKAAPSPKPSAPEADPAVEDQAAPAPQGKPVQRQIVAVPLARGTVAPPPRRSLLLPLLILVVGVAALVGLGLFAANLNDTLGKTNAELQAAHRDTETARKQHEAAETARKAAEAKATDLQSKLDAKADESARVERELKEQTAKLQQEVKDLEAKTAAALAAAAAAAKPADQAPAAPGDPAKPAPEKAP